MALSIGCACLGTTLNTLYAGLGTALNTGCADPRTALNTGCAVLRTALAGYWVCRPIQDNIKKTCETLPVTGKENTSYRRSNINS
jgi:hypothetical protein